MAIDWYMDFVDLRYEPARNELKALFYCEPAEGISREEAAGRVASESSTGTWTTLYSLPKRMKDLQATVYDIDGNYAMIAYPLDLWEKGNAAQLQSGIAGNIFGMKALRNLRLIDVSFPREYLDGFKGPHFGMEGIRKMMRVSGRPLTGAVPKPKVGFNAREHAEVGYETWMGGFDFVKDDENLTSQTFNRFEDRVTEMTRLRDRAEQETGEVKSAYLNITADIATMQERARMLAEHNWNFAMIDVVVAGTSAVQTMRDYCSDLGLAIHAHRAMHAAFSRNRKHGITMQFLAKLMRLIGVSQIHTGTAVGKLTGSKREVALLANVLRDRKVKAVSHILVEQDWGTIRSAFPVSSGGLHPGLVPDVLDIYGKELVLLVSGGIHGHPKGTRAGAIATMQAVEAWSDGMSLDEKAKSSPELGLALEKWGYYRPK
ncbi:MAG: type III ribulose-bisphosphate carboxylase [Methanolinea sp.]|nr:type III ribulose-bisphosphate carboxylase [Methanolinea sp.]